jgi:hypothetical protein
MDIETSQGMKDAIAWTENLFKMINDGGMWAVPRSTTIMVIDKVNKKATVIQQRKPDTSIDAVLKAMGWEVIYKK